MNARLSVVETLCIQTKSEETETSPQVSPGSASISEVLLPSKEVIPSSTEELNDNPLYVTLAFFLV